MVLTRRHNSEEQNTYLYTQVREAKLQGDRLKAYLQREQGRVGETEQRLEKEQAEKEREIEQLRTQLAEVRQKFVRRHSISSPFPTHLVSLSNPGPQGIDEMQLSFLKQAVFHLLTGFHAEDQLRAIVSILDFSAQERKAVYARVQEKKARNASVFM